MTRQTVQLVEWRTREVRLPRTDVAFLLTHAPHVVGVVPAFRPGRYRLTPRGLVGWFDGPTRHIAVRPKFPWPTLRLLLGVEPTQHPTDGDLEPDELFDVLAREFAAQLRGVTRIGLITGYRETNEVAPFLRGRLRVADQLHDAATRAFPDRFHIVESTPGYDVPWNRIPQCIAKRLLDEPILRKLTRHELSDAIQPLQHVPITLVTDADFKTAEAEPRAAHYRPLLAVCRLLHDGFGAAQLPTVGSGGFLVDLSRAFEELLARSLTIELANRSGWSIERHPVFEIGSTVLQPDILVRYQGKPWIVLDAKWKRVRTAPDAADVHQILAYAFVSGAKHAALVYPGTRFSCRTLRCPGSVTTVQMVRVNCVGTSDEWASSVTRLARVVVRSSDFERGTSMSLGPRSSSDHDGNSQREDLRD